MSFLNNYIVFKNPETYRTFNKQVDQITGQKNTMGILEQLAEIKAAEALEKGIEVGIQKGREEGLQKGRTEERELFVKNLLANTEFSPEKIASLASTSLDFVNKITEGIRIK